MTFFEDMPQKMKTRVVGDDYLITLMYHQPVDKNMNIRTSFT